MFWWNSSQFLGSRIPGVLETEARPGPEIVVPLVAAGISDGVQVLDSDRMIFPSRNMIFKSFSFVFLLVGGLEHFLFFHRLGMSSSQVTVIFFRGVETANQFRFGAR